MSLRLLWPHEIATCETDPGGCDHSTELLTPDPDGPHITVCVAHDTERTPVQ